MIEDLDDIISQLSTISSFVCAVHKICGINSPESLLAVAAINKLLALRMDIYKLQDTQESSTEEKVV